MTNWWSRAALLGASGAVALLIIGPLGTRFDLWEMGLGFQLLMVGSGVAAVVALVAIVAVTLAWRRRLWGDLGAAALGLLICLATVAHVSLLRHAAMTMPRIHNISTNTDDPPQFVEIVALRGADSNPLKLDAETIAPLQAETYPWVMPLVTPAAPEAAFAEARTALRDMGLEIVAEHPEQGLIEATATTFWFGFKDDVAIRVQPHAEGALVDVRSVSRVGIGDLGANADRIGEILRRLSGGDR